MTQALIDAAIALADALARENEALTQGDVARAAAMLSAKRWALGAFAEACKQRTERARECRTPPLAAAVSRRLETLATENRQLLEHAIRVQGRVIGAITRAALRGCRAGYSADGTFQSRGPLTVGFSTRA